MPDGIVFPAVLPRDAYKPSWVGVVTYALYADMTPEDFTRVTVQKHGGSGHLQTAYQQRGQRNGGKVRASGLSLV